MRGTIWLAAACGVLQLVQAYPPMPILDLYAKPQFLIDFVDQLSNVQDREVTKLRLLGDQYECLLPDLQEVAAGEEAAGVTMTVGIEALEFVQTLNSSVWMNDRFWSYQIVQGSEIQQLHLIPYRYQGHDDLLVGYDMNYMLGKYQPQLPEVTVMGGQNFLRTTYSNGEICDMTSWPRKTEVYYYCDESARSPEITHVREVKTCIYEMHISIPQLCQFPEMRPLERPSHAIICAAPNKLGIDVSKLLPLPRIEPPPTHSAGSSAVAAAETANKAQVLTFDLSDVDWSQDHAEFLIGQDGVLVFGEAPVLESRSVEDGDEESATYVTTREDKVYVGGREQTNDIEPEINDQVTLAPAEDPDDTVHIESETDYGDQPAMTTEDKQNDQSYQDHRTDLDGHNEQNDQDELHSEL